MTTPLSIRIFTASVGCMLGLAAFSASSAELPGASGAPTPVPHPTADYLPITPDKNACLMCHRPQKEGTDRAKGQIPRSHYLGERLSGERYECTLCHVSKDTQAPSYEPADPNAPVH